MFRRLRRPWAQEVAPKGLPGDRELRRREPRLPKLAPPTPRAARGARSSWGSKVQGGSDLWWQERDTEPRARAWSPSRCLPALPTVTGRAKQSRSVLKSLLLPPLCPTRTPRGSARRCPGLAECEVPPGGSGKEAPDFLGALLGELLPSRFREFLQQLQEKCLEPPEPQRPEDAQGGEGLLESSEQPAQAVSHCPRSHSQEEPGRDVPPPQAHSGPPTSPGSQRPQHCVIPGVRPSTAEVPLSVPAAPSSQTCDKMRRFVQTPTVRPGLVEEYCRVEYGFRPMRWPSPARGPPKLKAVLIRSSSGEGSGPRRRCCPFRVRFADETLRDTALRYWERSCAVRQNILEDQTTSQPTVSERVCGSFGRWLESLPGAPNLRTKEAVADPSCWDSPHLPTRRLQDLLSEGALRTAACPSSLGPPPQGSRGDLRTFLDIHSLLESRSWGQKLESSLPDLVLQSVLKRGRPKGYGS